jgi:macrolide transport system ATP-binding/permease protein
MRARSTSLRRSLVLSKVCVVFVTRLSTENCRSGDPKKSARIVDTAPVAPAVAAMLQHPAECSVHQIDLNLGVSNEGTMSDRIGSTQTALLHQYSAWLVSSFAAMALILSIVGLYGVIAFSVSRRTREIGVRMALGADRSSVVLMILREAGKMVTLGVLVGLLASFGLSRLIASMVFGVSTSDPLTFAGVAMVLAAVALVACYVPARRASAVDPIVTLRYE